MGKAGNELFVIGSTTGLAEIKAAQGELRKAIESAASLIDRLLEATEQGKRNRSLIEILIIKSIICKLNNEQNKALNILERALTLAEPEEYIQVFTDEGNLIKELLSDAATQSKNRSFILKLLEAFKENKRRF